MAGPAGLIESLVAVARIETLPAAPHDPVTRVEDWVTGWARQAAAELFASGKAAVTTSRGTVRAWLTRPAWHRNGTLRTRSISDKRGHGGGWRPLGHRDEHELQREVQDYLTTELTRLVGG